MKESLSYLDNLLSHEKPSRKSSSRRDFYQVYNAGKSQIPWLYFANPEKNIL